MEVTTYTAVCRRVGGWWAIEVPDVPGVHTQSKRLDQVKNMARDAIAVTLDVPPDSFEVDLTVELDRDSESAIQRLQEARTGLDRAKDELGDAATAAAATLVKAAGLTVRDAGRLLNVSFQRIDQLLKDARGQQRR